LLRAFTVTAYYSLQYTGFVERSAQVQVSYMIICITFYQNTQVQRSYYSNSV